ncbi:MAG: hypothetical protein ACLFM0_06125 [Spirochaetales bacterium]
MADEEGSPYVRRKPRRRAAKRAYAITNFYPGYGDGDGSLDRIEPISPVRMQRILARYDMSTAQTRTSGLGPPLLETPVSVELTGEEKSPIRVPADRERSRATNQSGEAGRQRTARKAGSGTETTAFTDEAMGTIIDLEA